MTIKRSSGQLVLCLISLFVSWVALPSKGVANTFGAFPQEAPKRLGGGHVEAIAFSPDGRTVVATHRTDPTTSLWAVQTLIFWDPQTQAQVGEIRIKDIHSIAFSQDGALLALGLENRNILIWDVAGQNQEGAILSPTPFEVVSIAFSPDGTILASAGGWRDGSVYLWDVQTQQLLGTLTGGTQQKVLAIAFSPDGKSLASGGDDQDGRVRLWDVQTQQQSGLLTGPLDFTFDLAFSPDGNTLASSGGAQDRAVYLWDVQAQGLVGVLRGHSARVGSVAFSPDGRLLASSVLVDNTIHLWDVAVQEEVGLLTGHDASDFGGGNRPDQVAFSKDGKWLASGSENGVELWELNLTGPIAFDPQPAGGATDVFYKPVLHWTPGEFAQYHDVYFGTRFADVNEAGNTDPTGPDSVYRGRQGETTYAVPAPLDFERTYYWRIDEINGPPDNTVFKGDVWSFTTEPIAIPINRITATASGFFGSSVPENTVNGSGMVDHVHGVAASDMWISAGLPATIEYAFDKPYRLHELWIWNANQLIEAFVGFGAKDVVIEHSLDGENWTVLEDVGPLAQAMGTEGYAHNNTIDFGGAVAQQVRMTVNSVHGIAPQASLSEVRFFAIPTYASRPQPAEDALAEDVDITLRWRSGREAASHEVLLSSDPTAIEDGSALVAVVDENRYSPDLLVYGTTYTWRVNEVNETEDASTYLGDPWTFTTPPFGVVDDMEVYRDQEFFEIWATWRDGLGNPANGALVGNGGTGAPETDVVHSGRQSLPIHFDHTRATASETTRTFEPPHDWTQSGIQSLVVYFAKGAHSGEASVRLYVRINETQVVYPEPLVSLARDQWTQWTIDLMSLGTDLSQVKTLTIGIEGAGTQGVVYVDDIRLYPGAPV